MDSAPSNCITCQISGKSKHPENLDQIGPKSSFFTQISKNNSQILIQHPRNISHSQFQKDRRILKIWTKLGLKSPFLSKFRKLNPGNELSIPCLCRVQFFRKIEAFRKFGPNLPKITCVPLVVTCRALVVA